MDATSLPRLSEELAATIAHAAFTVTHGPADQVTNSDGTPRSSIPSGSARRALFAQLATCFDYLVTRRKKNWMGRIGRQHTADEVIHSVVNGILSIGFNVIGGGREIKYMRTVGLIGNRVTQVIILPAAVTQAGRCGLCNGW